VVNLTFKWSELARIDGFSLFLHKLLLIYGEKKINFKRWFYCHG